MIKVKIYYHDTDCGGVVYYANYLKYFEQARTEFFKERGVSINGLADSGTFFVVVRQEVDYKSPAVYGDTLLVYSRVADITAVKVDFEHQVKSEESQLICQARTVLVCVDSDLKPKAIPQDLKEKISVSDFC